MNTDIRWLEPVELPFELVRTAFCDNAQRIFQSVDSVADGRSSVNQLHAKVAGVELNREVNVMILNTNFSGDAPKPISIEFVWKAAQSPQLFPTMKATLHVRPLGDHSQMDFHGVYSPPLGIVGEAIDGVFGAGVAQSCVKNFVGDLKVRLVECINQPVSE